MQSISNKKAGRKESPKKLKSSTNTEDKPYKDQGTDAGVTG